MERRKIFSSSSEFVRPLLKQVVADVFDKADKLRNVFPRFDVLYFVHAIDGLRR